ncbi:hypothetical protein RB195_002329 [Necator americanus]|uniref:Peripheral subunit-binding (PSBD) domain-containing protein n=1 Tax=Necator americanus TaxID=51031 RepID=A0ABR1DII5_NECAM
MHPSRSIASSVRQFTTAAHPSRLCGPAVRLLMLQYGINEKDVKATGPKNNILKSDIFAMIKAGGLKPLDVTVVLPPKPTSPLKEQVQKTAAAPIGSVRHVEPFVDIPLSNVRATIAKRLSQSKQSIPHEYQSAVVHADAVLAIQSELRSKKVAVSLNDFIIKAAALALRAVPEVNVQYSAEAQQINHLPRVDISVAVATPSGLITPIVASADILGVQDISARVRELASRARENKLQPSEFQGGTFTVSNLGMFGSVEQFTAIINPPQAAILAVGGTRTELDQNFKPQNKFTVTLCFDARAITETSARRFLDHFAASLSDPDFMVAQPIDPMLNFDFARLL